MTDDSPKIVTNKNDPDTVEESTSKERNTIQDSKKTRPMVSMNKIITIITIYFSFLAINLLQYLQ